MRKDIITSDATVETSQESRDAAHTSFDPTLGLPPSSIRPISIHINRARDYEIMSVPGNINTAPPPSSFDGNEDFYEESRLAKFRRKLLEEPLIPLGCALTCWALFEATRSIKSGDRYRTNRMFRRRIYAQGFTLLAMIAGSAYWEGDRKKRKQYDGLVEEKKTKEKHEAWLRELEIRDEEEQELRKMRNRLMQSKTAERMNLTEAEKRSIENKQKQEAGQPKGGFGEVRSVLEDSESKGQGRIFAAAQELWRGRR
ncbi:unnamed protein product [Zymoseptoria tritici ST99CH_1A5]|uniref:HIG1 domain-containing protein n=2 Tax=Zymoseptoria tritici TaxID=1047171 RepID=A0A1X7RQA3_ZYMT9|nr:unnamed protein product [Zymoseptoria tritici ST99CH_3D7]SMR51511.1 unnamed protein product [Zymoseptoria tritici ST99CH_3D1]SMY23268.1 unnamed protein product [Zymoseptoria tritici ST99CH_1A5]